MNGAHELEPVRCCWQRVVIPTYPVQAADPNPMFLEKRAYQGSSGKVYPNPFTDRVALEIAEDPNHLFATGMNRWVQMESKAAPEMPEVRARS